MNGMTMLKNLIMKGNTPEDILSQTRIDNPIIRNLISMAKKGNTQDLENFARNIFKEKGRDFDKEFNDFKNSIK